MNRSMKRILCITAAALVITGWSTWDLNPDPDLHLPLMNPSISFETNPPRTDVPNDGSSYSFKLAREQRLSQERSDASAVEPASGAERLTYEDSKTMTRR
ncbi:MAG: hypothetical protein K0S39_6226 [Paenibacillus sp.]|nr:hypothetical protein [Paenibacillus sp.]